MGGLGFYASLCICSKLGNVSKDKMVVSFILWYFCFVVLHLVNLTTAVKLKIFIHFPSNVRTCYIGFVIVMLNDHLRKRTPSFLKLVNCKIYVFALFTIAQNIWNVWNKSHEKSFEGLYINYPIWNMYSWENILYS